MNVVVPPASRATRTGWYVYGVVPSAELPAEALADADGVDPAGRVVLLEDGPLSAIASEVRLAEFGEAEIESRLHDAEWLEQKVRAHESVLESALPWSPLVPFRFGTIFLSEAQARSMLRENAHMRETLERLRGAVELGVKAFLHEAEHQRGDQEALSEPAQGGRGYLMRKQRVRRAAETRARVAAESAQVIHDRLTAAARASRLNRLQPKEVTADAGDMILNGAYLVDVESRAAFENALGSVAQSYARDGVTCELTGPWPPYNFVDLGAEE